MREKKKKSFLGKILKDLRKSLKRKYKISYSQCGEDIIIAFILNTMRIKKPSYLDIGAHDPFHFNNTFLFYQKGCTGVNIEPNPFLFKRLLSKRGRDINLNAGIAAKEGSLDFYVITTDASTLSTFSKETAERYCSFGNQKIKEILKINVLNVNDVVKKHFSQKPNLVSLDVEGLEMEILRSFDFGSFRPEVFCIETITYAEEKKVAEITEYMQSVGYMVHADTWINTIFVDKAAWDNAALSRER
ncbi:MAG TPA: FkbM family methyltransferase [Thermodesulfobacteriota bacterium]|nr:FkbM family methyltransferase [Thermodesulfobacteriota bacterium]